MDDFSGALERIVLGAERKVMLTGADRRPTAYHEAGHALVGMLTPGADPVRKVSIIPRTMSLGVTMSAPESDRFNYDTRARGGGGRVRRRDHRRRERHPSGDAARAQHGRPVRDAQRGRLVAVLPQDGGRWGAYAAPQVSERTRQRVDEEVRRLIEEAHDEAMRLLAENRSRLDGIAVALLRDETLAHRPRLPRGSTPSPCSSTSMRLPRLSLRAAICCIRASRFPPGRPTSRPSG
jgi:cell division protease FtsH